MHKKIKNDPVVFPEAIIISDALKNLILGILKKDPGHRLLLTEIKVNLNFKAFFLRLLFQSHPWVTKDGTQFMPNEQENCHLVTVTEEEIENSVKVFCRLDTLILVKAMGHRKRFGNPFRQTTTSSLRIRRKSSSVKDPSYYAVGAGMNQKSNLV